MAIPFAWLSGWICWEILQIVLRSADNQRFKISSKSAQTLGLCLLLALAFAHAERRLEGEWRDLRQRPAAAQDPIVKHLKDHAGHSECVYCEKPIYAFQAGLPMPPEIAMVTLKRYWSGQINNAEILELCSHYQPAQLLLKPDMIDDDWRKFLGGYTMVYQDKTLNFYLQKLR